MKGFRVDKAEGGFIIREIHPNTKSDKRKYAAAADWKEVLKILKRWLKKM